MTERRRIVAKENYFLNSLSEVNLDTAGSEEPFMIILSAVRSEVSTEFEVNDISSDSKLKMTDVSGTISDPVIIFSCLMTLIKGTDGSRNVCHLNKLTRLLTR